jgi:hypothetical protein
MNKMVKVTALSKLETLAALLAKRELQITWLHSEMKKLRRGEARNKASKKQRAKS